MVRRLVLLLLVSLSIWISSVSSNCLAGPLKKQVTKYGTSEEFCEYNGMKFLPGAKFRLAAPTCYDCSCSKSGLSCCGFGFAAGSIRGPEGCVAENDACKVVFVQENDHSKKCEAGKPPATNKKKNTIRRP